LRKRLGRGGVGKTIVMGLLERHGDIRLKVIPNTKRKTLYNEVKQKIEKGSEVFTDAFPAYNGLENFYLHKIIEHTETYVKGNVHTNGIENFWSLFKRGIIGVYHAVEPFHLDRCLDEFSARFNSLKDSDFERFSKTVKSIAGIRLTYGELIGKLEGTRC